MSKRNDIKWTKRAILRALDGQVSKKCIVNRGCEWVVNGKTRIDSRGGEWVVQGKYCILSPLDDSTWDLWICNPDDLCAGLHQKSVNHRVRKLEKVPQNRPFTILKGEAHITLPGLDDLVSNPDLLRLLGIRRKKQLSAAQKKALLERLTIRRKAKAA